jgi:pyruvate/2-oxoglutarate/acetoin dehydrogenase E1 component
MMAADALAESGISAELIDLAVLRPLDMAPIHQSVRKTGRLITADNGFRTLGLGAEIVAEVVGHNFSGLRAAPQRFGLPGYPTPSSRALAADYYPTAIDLFDGAVAMCGRDASALAAIRQRMVNERNKVPIDVPCAAFRGPF